MIDYTKEYGIVLEAGGARGAYQMGALKAIIEKGIHVKGIVGTSIGAINGAFFAQEDLGKAIDLWYDITCSKIMTDEDGIIENIIAFNYKQVSMARLVDRTVKIARDKGVDITPFKKLLNEGLDEEKIRASDIDFGLVTVSLTDKKPLELFIEDIEQGQLINYVLASAYLPIFKREKLGGKRFVDGAFHNRIPIQMLIGKGYKDIIVLKIQGIGIARWVNTRGVNLIEISPRELLGKTIEFSPKRIKHNIDLGYFDTFKALDNLKGRRYYIQSDKTESYFMERFLRLEKETIQKLRWYSLGNNSSRYRLVLEGFLPVLARKLKLRRGWVYEDIAIAVIDRVAIKMDLTRFKIYAYDEIVGLVKANIEDYKVQINYSNTSRGFDHLLVEIIDVL